MTDHQHHSDIRTSHSHPLRIATLPIGENGGAVGVTFAPGKKQAIAMTGSWSRDLMLDLQAIKQWGASDLITLLEPQEFEELEITQLPQQAMVCGIRWHGLPITDGAAPDARFLEPWATLSPTFVENLRAGQRVVVHCKGGLGRAGTVACLLLMSSVSATDADDAMKQVRAARPGAIETKAQEDFLREWSVHAKGRVT
jgi:protein-tyrosine phosphatase